MSLRHWEATRDAIRTKLDESLMTAGAPPGEKDTLAGMLATVAIDAYKGSVYGSFQPLEDVWTAP